MIQIIIKFRAEKILSTFLSYIKPPFEGRKISCTETISYAHLKMESKAHFRYTIWFMISEKSITRCTFLHCGAHMHQKFQQGIKKKICVPKFPIYSAFRLPSCELTVFIDTNTCIPYRRPDFQNILERKFWTVVRY